MYHEPALPKFKKTQGPRGSSKDPPPALEQPPQNAAPMPPMPVRIRGRCENKTLKNPYTRTSQARQTMQQWTPQNERGSGRGGKRKKNVTLESRPVPGTKGTAEEYLQSSKKSLISNPAPPQDPHLHPHPASPSTTHRAYPPPIPSPPPQK